MPRRNQRTHYDFCIGRAIEEWDHRKLLLQLTAQISLARFAVTEAERARALGRLEAADELLCELRRRDDQQALWRA